MGHHLAMTATNDRARHKSRGRGLAHGSNPTPFPRLSPFRAPERREGGAAQLPPESCDVTILPRLRQALSFEESSTPSITPTNRGTLRARALPPSPYHPFYCALQYLKETCNRPTTPRRTRTSTHYGCF